MITSKEEYHSFLEADAEALGIKGNIFVNRLLNPIYRYECALRRHEYYYNCLKGILFRPIVIVSGIRHRTLGVKLGFTIPINVFDKGLSLAHVGTVIVTPNARVGKNCRLHACTNIGVAAGTDIAPIVGDNVYIGPGVKIFGGIRIADDIAIGANSVVNKDFTTPGITIAGVPARKISDKGSYGLI